MRGQWRQARKGAEERASVQREASLAGTGTPKQRSGWGNAPETGARSPSAVSGGTSFPGLMPSVANPAAAPPQRAGLWSLTGRLSDGPTLTGRHTINELVFISNN